MVVMYSIDELQSLSWLFTFYIGNFVYNFINLIKCVCVCTHVCVCLSACQWHMYAGHRTILRSPLSSLSLYGIRGLNSSQQACGLQTPLPASCLDGPF